MAKGQLAKNKKRIKEIMTSLNMARKKHIDGSCDISGKVAKLEKALRSSIPAVQKKAVELTSFNELSSLLKHNKTAQLRHQFKFCNDELYNLDCRKNILGAIFKAKRLYLSSSKLMPGIVPVLKEDNIDEPAFITLEARYYEEVARNYQCDAQWTSIVSEINELIDKAIVAWTKATQLDQDKLKWGFTLESFESHRDTLIKGVCNKKIKAIVISEEQDAYTEIKSAEDFCRAVKKYECFQEQLEKLYTVNAILLLQKFIITRLYHLNRAKCNTVKILPSTNLPFDSRKAQNDIMGHLLFAKVNTEIDLETEEGLLELLNRVQIRASTEGTTIIDVDSIWKKLEKEESTEAFKTMMAEAMCMAMRFLSQLKK